MPLESGSSNKTVGHNIKEMEASGHPPKQAIAASLKEAGKSNQDTRPGPPVKPMPREPHPSDVPPQRDVSSVKPASGPMSNNGPNGTAEGLPKTVEPFAKTGDATGAAMSVDAIKAFGDKHPMGRKR